MFASSNFPRLSRRTFSRIEQRQFNSRKWACTDTVGGLQTKRSKFMLYPYFAVLGFGFAGIYDPTAIPSSTIDNNCENELDLYCSWLLVWMYRCYVGYGPSFVWKEDILVSSMCLVARTVHRFHAENRWRLFVILHNVNTNECVWY